MKKLLIFIVVLGLVGCDKQQTEQERLNEPFIGEWMVGNHNEDSIIFTKDFKTTWKIGSYGNIVLDSEYTLYNSQIIFKNITINKIYPSGSEIGDNYEFNEDQTVLKIGHFAAFNKK